MWGGFPCLSKLARFRLSLCGDVCQLLEPIGLIFTRSYIKLGFYGHNPTNFRLICIMGAQQLIFFCINAQKVEQSREFLILLTLKYKAQPQDVLVFLFSLQFLAFRRCFSVCLLLFYFDLELSAFSFYFLVLNLSIIYFEFGVFICYYTQL